MGIETRAELGDSFKEVARKNEQLKLTDLKKDKGDIVFLQGDPADCLYLVLEGLIEEKIDDPLGNARQQTTTLIGPGDISGWNAILGEGEKYTTSATVAKNSRILCIPASILLPFMQSDPQIAEELLKLMTTAVKNADEHNTVLKSDNPKRKVASALLDYAQVGGINGLTQVSIAQRTGLNRASISTDVLPYLERRNAIIREGEKGKRRITGISQDKLKAIAKRS